MVNMDTFGGSIKSLREQSGFPLRKVAAFLDIDPAILSKIERGIRKANRELVLEIADFFEVDENILLVTWLSDKILYAIHEEANAEKAIHLAEQKIAYKRSVLISNETINKDFKRVLSRFPAVKKAWFFGSFARGEDDAESDIDILIDVPRDISFTLFDLADIQEQLSRFSWRRIDVVMARAMKASVKERIQHDLELFYEA